MKIQDYGFGTLKIITKVTASGIYDFERIFYSIEKGIPEFNPLTEKLAIVHNGNRIGSITENIEAITISMAGFLPLTITKKKGFYLEHDRTSVILSYLLFALDQKQSYHLSETLLSLRNKLISLFQTDLTYVFQEVRSEIEV